MPDRNFDFENQKSDINPGRISTTWSNLWSTRRKEIIFGITIFLVATLSFGLGYLANQKLNRAPIVIENYPAN